MVTATDLSSPIVVSCVGLEGRTGSKMISVLHLTLENKMKKIGLIVASTAVAVLVSGSAWANGPNTRHAHDGNYRQMEKRGVSKDQVIRQYMRAFDQMDRNRDNRIGPREMRRGHRDGHGSHRGHGARNDHRSHDADRGYDRRHGSDRGHYRGARKNDLITDRMYRRFDTNNNGFLTRSEMRQGIRHRFNRSDWNNNGYLGPRELREARWYKGWTPMPRHRR